MAQSTEINAFAAATYALPGPTILSTRGIVAVPYASAAIACAPPTLNRRTPRAARVPRPDVARPASNAAAMTVASGFGQTTITSPTSATIAGMAVISSEDGSG